MYVVWIVALGIILLVAVMSDLYNFKIGNGLFIVGLPVGIVLGIMTEHSIFSIVSGILIPILFLFILHVFSMIGASDIKLLSVVGAFIGGKGVVQIILITFLAGGIISLVQMKRHGIFKERFRYLAGYSVSLIENRIIVPYEKMDFKETRHLIHFSLCILIAVGFFFIKEGLL